MLEGASHPKQCLTKEEVKLGIFIYLYRLKIAYLTVSYVDKGVRVIKLVQF